MGERLSSCQSRQILDNVPPPDKFPLLYEASVSPCKFEQLKICPLMFTFSVLSQYYSSSPHVPVQHGQMDVIIFEENDLEEWLVLNYHGIP